MPMFDYELQDQDVTVSTGSVWLDGQPAVGRIEFSTGDRWWRTRAITASPDPTASGRILCSAVPPDSPDEVQQTGATG